MQILEHIRGKNNFFFQIKTIKIKDLGKHVINHWSNSLTPQWSRQAIKTISSRVLDHSTWFNGVTTNLFVMGVISLLKISSLN